MLHNVIKMSSNLRPVRRSLVNRAICNRLLSTKAEEAEDGPVKFSTSPAAKKTVVPTIRKVDVDMPWYQPYSVVASVAVFLIYFCILREENDVDSEFTKSLYERIHGLEKHQLMMSYKFNKEQGLSVDEIEERLKKLENDKPIN